MRSRKRALCSHSHSLFTRVPHSPLLFHERPAFPTPSSREARLSTPFSRESHIPDFSHRYNPEYHFLSQSRICAQNLANPASRLAIKSRIPLRFSKSRTVFWSCSLATQQSGSQRLQSFFQREGSGDEIGNTKVNECNSHARRRAATVKKSLTFFFHQKYSKMLAMPNSILTTSNFPKFEFEGYLF